MIGGLLPLRSRKDQAPGVNWSSEEVIRKGAFCN